MNVNASLPVHPAQHAPGGSENFPKKEKKKRLSHWIHFSERRILLITLFPIWLRLPMPRLLDSCISTGKFWQVDTAQKCRGERSRCIAFVYTSPNFWPHWFPSTLKQMSLCTAHRRPIKTQWPSQICWTPTLMLTWPRDHVLLRQWQVSAVSSLWLMVFNIYAKVLPSGHMAESSTISQTAHFLLKRTKSNVFDDRGLFLMKTDSMSGS